MDRQEKRRQEKNKDREHEKKAQQAYEVARERQRLPVNSVWLIVLGTVLVGLIIYAWVFGMAAPW